MTIRRDERGSTVAEFALIATVLFSLFLGLMGLGLSEASDNAGVNAARAGARAGTVNFYCADNSCSPATTPSSLTGITSAVTNSLAGMASGTPTVAVTCLDGSTTSLTQKNCDAKIVPDQDLVKVSVTWTRLASYPLGSPTTRTDSATMTIHGGGSGTSDTTACQATGFVSPSQTSISGGGDTGPLAGNVTITINTNSFCAAPLEISFNTGTTFNQSTPVDMTANGADYTFTITPSAYSWAGGTYPFTITDGLGHALTFDAVPTLTVTGASCQISAASLSPGTVVLANAQPSALYQDVSLSLTTTSGCTNVTTTYSPTSSQTVTTSLTGTAPNFTLTIPKAAYQWTIGAKQFTFTDAATNTNLQTPTSVLLQVGYVCAVTVSSNPASVTASGNGNLSADVVVTATAAAGANCAGLSMTYSYATGFTDSITMTTQSSGVYQATIRKNAHNFSVGSWAITFSATNATTVATSPSPVTLQVS